MKVTLLTKRATVNVIAENAAHALMVFLSEPECQGFDVLAAQITMVTSPVDAVKKTIEFTQTTGVEVLGYHPLQPIADVDKLHVWVVSVDLERSVEFTAANPPAAMRQAPTEEDTEVSQLPDTQNFEKREDGWYFRGVDEDSYGPYGSFDEARTQYQEYAKWVENGKPV